MKSPDSLPYDFVHATHDYGESPVPKGGIVFHLAEGCDPLSYLAGDNVIRGVSAHFVIQPTGRVVQMLRLDHTSGSIKASDVRTTTDPDGDYGRRYTRYLPDDILEGKVNQRTISVEMAGFARKGWSCDGESYPAGPNIKQVATAIELVHKLRTKYARPIGVNVHRDFADYKACPGDAKGIRRLLDDTGHGREGVALPPPEPVPDACELALAAAKEKLADAQDAIADALVLSRRATERLSDYVPAAHEVTP